MAGKTGAFLGMLKGEAKKLKPKSKPVDDETEGAAYSKMETGKPLGDVVGGEPDDDEEEEEEESKEEPSGNGVSFDALANALNIPQERRASARAALKLFIKSCVRGSGKSAVSYEDDYI